MNKYEAAVKRYIKTQTARFKRLGFDRMRCQQKAISGGNGQCHVCQRLEIEESEVEFAVNYLTILVEFYEQEK